MADSVQRGAAQRTSFFPESLAENDSWQPTARDSGKKLLNETACQIMGIVSREGLPRQVPPVVSQQPLKGGVESVPVRRRSRKSPDGSTGTSQR